ncbi:DUF4145 domain-containing protein [Actinoallomurus sp. CA-150999]|uniref:DUF4145 domain-containing protein n=1 Tax=Actinoallomurus sp. CA-150999 TaxID=3239887 RepID=UPI003D900A2B
MQLPTEYNLEQCGSCGGVSVSVREDYGDGIEHGDYYTIYPGTPNLSFEVPEALRREYNEATSCFKAKAYTAAVVMVRRTLEGTCKENNVQERTLARSLEKLKESGLINDTLAEWMDALRVVGNEGAHYTGQPVARVDAEDALAFTEALLDHIYVLRKRFEQFKARREQGK